MALREVSPAGGELAKPLVISDEEAVVALKSGEVYIGPDGVFQRVVGPQEDFPTRLRQIGTAVDVDSTPLKDDITYSYVILFTPKSRVVSSQEVPMTPQEQAAVVITAAKALIRVGLNDKTGCMVPAPGKNTFADFLIAADGTTPLKKSTLPTLRQIADCRVKDQGVNPPVNVKEIP